MLDLFVEWVLTNFLLPGLASSLSLPDVHLQKSWNYRHVPPHPALDIFYSYLILPSTNFQICFITDISDFNNFWLSIIFSLLLF
jgi:hypothetical protein